MSTRSVFMRSTEPINRYLKKVGIEGVVQSDRSQKMKNLVKLRNKAYGISSVIDEINRTRERRELRENKSSLYS